MTSPGGEGALRWWALIAAAVGTALVGTFPLMGIAFLASGLAYLLVHGARATAIAAILGGIVYTAIMAPGSAVFVAITSIALYVSVFALRTESTLAVGARIALAFSVAGIANALVGAWMAGTSVDAILTKTTGEIVANFGEADPGVTEATISALREGAATAVAIWPSIHVVQGVLMAIVAIIAVRWLSKRAGLGFTIPGLGSMDLSIHVIWPLVVGLVLWALAKFGVPQADLADRIGVNLLVVARVLLAVQGAAVLTAFADAREWKSAGRILGSFVALFLESIFWFVSGVGLVDMWMNVRRLPRDRGGADTTVTEER